MDAAGTEIAIAAAANVGTLIWTVATIKAHVGNLQGWVKALAEDLRNTHDLALENRTKLETLPCKNCRETQET